MSGLLGEMFEYRTHYRWAVIVIVLAFVGLIARFFQIQIVEGERFESLATISHVARERVPARRGTIRDRNGEVLATDIEVSDLMFVPKYVKEPEREISRLAELGVVDTAEAEAIRKIIEDTKNSTKRLQKLVAKRNLVGSRCPHDLSPMTFDAGRGRLICPQCGQTFIDQKAVLLTHMFELPGFSLRTRTLRHYPSRELAAHVVGFLNEASPEDIERSGGRLKPGDLVGRFGVERSLEATLRGTPGEDVFIRTAGGGRVAPADMPDPFQGLESTAPVPGNDVVLTLDLGLQAVAREALAPHRSGAVVVLDADTGEVLAMVSHPSFSPEPVLQASNKNAPAVDPVYAPQLNKAVSAYPPGSVFKAFTAIAGLNEALVTDEDTVACPGFYLFRGHRFNCHKRYGHGSKIDLVEALAVSCDVYFYRLGEQLGIESLAHYARDVFGIGERTGIELAESAGFVPSERWYSRHFRFGLLPGFALNTAVGQGDVRATPLGLARAYAALVNGGKLLVPHLVLSVTDPTTGLVTTTQPEVQRVLDIPEDYVELVEEGLYKAVNALGGTAFDARIPELPFAGKTGTAQAREFRKEASDDVAAWLLGDHAWFVGYAPAKRPRIVVAAFVEHGGFGSHVAAPVARKVIAAYYAEHADEFVDLWKGMEDLDMLEIVK